MKLITGIPHAGIRCRDRKEYERVLDFYIRILGLEKIRQWGEGESEAVMLDTGNGCIEVFASGKQADETGGLDHICLSADDVDHVIEIIEEEGYQILIRPRDFFKVPGVVIRYAYAKGPAGERVEINKERKI